MKAFSAETQISRQQKTQTEQAAQRALTRRKQMAGDTQIHQATSAAWNEALKKGNPGVSPKLWSSAASVSLILGLKYIYSAM